MRCRTRLLVLALALGCACPAAAETFLLKSGARIYGVEEKHPRGEPSDEWMTVRTSYGRVSFKKADLKRKLTKGEERSTLYIEEARITSVEGKAFKSTDGGKSWTRIPWKVGKSDSAVVGEFPPRVRAGEQVKTDAKSAIDLDVGWGVVRLAPESLLELQMFKGATLKLTQGKMGARLEELPKGRRFQVETPEATMGVEGTTFLIESNGATRIAVRSGAVLANARRIGPGQVQLVAPSGEIEVTPLSADDRGFFAELAKAIALPRISWVPIPAGKHVMKAESQEALEGSQRHLVHGTYDVAPFLISKYEVTRGEFATFKRWLDVHGDTRLWPDGRPPGVKYHCSPETPLQGWEEPGWRMEDVCVTGVFAEGARAFCRWLGGRLPSEVEWEFAACGGGLGQGDLRTPEDYLSFAWLAENSGRETTEFGPKDTWAKTYAELGCRYHPVGGKLANPLGLHDLMGNAVEWAASGPTCFLRGGHVRTVGWSGGSRLWS